MNKALVEHSKTATEQPLHMMKKAFQK